VSDDEIFVTAIAVLIGVGGWLWWLANVSAIAPFRRAGRVSIDALIGVLCLCLAILAVILRTAAASDVREAPQYLFMYMVLGLAWLRVAQWLFPMLGLHPRDDLLERRNKAALPAWAGALIGVTCCYAGGNIGDGPGWWVVIFSAGLASAALGLTWLTAGQYTDLVEAVTVGRDPAAGWRLGALLASAGMIYGFAVTGDWVSASLTVSDFLWRAAPAIVLVVASVATERVLRPTAQRPNAPLISGGVVPAIAYLAFAVAAISLSGSPQ
jgi:uncharacterized membrane protein YjfL (UPF0719 family)